MPTIIIVLQGLFELLGVGGFLVGYFSGVWWLMITGGILAVLDDLIEMGMGTLHPLFPVLLALVLAVVMTPWYTGIFWASAAFKVLGIRTSILKVVAPTKVLVRAAPQTGTQ